MDGFNQTIESIITAYLQYDAYQYGKKQVDYLLRNILPLSIILIFIYFIVKK